MDVTLVATPDPEPEPGKPLVSGMFWNGVWHNGVTSATAAASTLPMWRSSAWFCPHCGGAL